MINVGTSIPALGMDTGVEENCPETPPGSAQQQSPGQCLMPPVPPKLSSWLQAFGASSPSQEQQLSHGELLSRGTGGWRRRGSGTWQEGERKEERSNGKMGWKGKRMKRERQRGKGPKVVAPLLPPLPGEVAHRGRSRLCSSRQEALDPAELLQRSMHVNQPDRQRGEKQGG